MTNVIQQHYHQLMIFDHGRDLSVRTFQERFCKDSPNKYDLLTQVEFCAPSTAEIRYIMDKHVWTNENLDEYLMIILM